MQERNVINQATSEDLFEVAKEFETEQDTNLMSRKELTNEIARLLEYIAELRFPCKEGDVECLKHKRKNCVCICEEGDTNG